MLLQSVSGYKYIYGSENVYLFRKSFLISRENSAGPFEMPNVMTLNWYKPNSVAKAAYFLLLSFKGICQKPFFRWKLEKYLQRDKLPNINCILFLHTYLMVLYFLFV